MWPVVLVLPGPDAAVVVVRPARVVVVALALVVVVRRGWGTKPNGSVVVVELLAFAPAWAPPPPPAPVMVRSGWKTVAVGPPITTANPTTAASTALVAPTCRRRRSWRPLR